jgi:hypothetical protein
MTTAQDLIKLSLKAIGVLGQGQTVRPEQLNDALTILNMMIGQWNRKRWLIPHLVEAKLLATGALSYSVGPGADFNIPRPDRLEDAFVRLNSQGASTGGGDFNADFNADFSTSQLVVQPNIPVDYPLIILSAREDYDRISLKSMGAFPYYVFYDSDYPIGKVYFWPVPSSAYEMHIIVKGTLQSFPQQQTVINLPPEYMEAIYYNLAGRLAPIYGVDPKPVIVALAAAGLNTIRQANVQIPELRLPGVLTRNSRSASLPTFVGKPGI